MLLKGFHYIGGWTRKNVTFQIIQTILSIELNAQVLVPDDGHHPVNWKLHVLGGGLNQVYNGVCPESDVRLQKGRNPT